MEPSTAVDYDQYFERFGEAKWDCTDWELPKQWEAQNRQCPDCATATRKLIDEVYDGDENVGVKVYCAPCAQLMKKSGVDKWIAAGRKCAHCGKQTALSNDVLCASCLKANLAKPKPTDEPHGNKYSDLVDFVAVQQPLERLRKWLNVHFEYAYGDYLLAFGNVVAQQVDEAIRWSGDRDLRQSFKRTELDYYYLMDRAAAFFAWYVYRNTIQSVNFYYAVVNRGRQKRFSDERDLENPEHLSNWLNESLLEAMYPLHPPVEKALEGAPELAPRRAEERLADEVMESDLAGRIAKMLIPSDSDASPCCVDPGKAAHFLVERELYLLPNASRIYRLSRNAVLQERARASQVDNLIKSWTRVWPTLRNSTLTVLAIVAIALVLVKCSAN